MNKNNIIAFVSILFIFVSGLIIKNEFIDKDDIVVLTEENEIQSSDLENNINEETSDEEVEENIQSNIENKEVTIYISGEVNTPGVVTLNEGERLTNAIDKVGGFTKDADLNGVNIAAKIEDEQHYIIPKKGEVSISNSKEASSSERNKSSKININTATKEELDTLPGVGEATANKIINQREDAGEFKNIEEVKNVNGIGEKKFEEMKNLISVK